MCIAALRLSHALEQEKLPQRHVDHLAGAAVLDQRVLAAELLDAVEISLRAEVIAHLDLEHGLRAPLRQVATRIPPRLRSNPLPELGLPGLGRASNAAAGGDGARFVVWTPGTLNAMQRQGFVPH